MNPKRNGSRKWSRRLWLVDCICLNALHALVNWRSPPRSRIINYLRRQGTIYFQSNKKTLLSYHTCQGMLSLLSYFTVEYILFILVLISAESMFSSFWIYSSVSSVKGRISWRDPPMNATKDWRHEQRTNNEVTTTIHRMIRRTNQLVLIWMKYSSDSPMHRFEQFSLLFSQSDNGNHRNQAWLHFPRLDYLPFIGDLHLLENRPIVWIDSGTLSSSNTNR